MEELKSE